MNDGEKIIVDVARDRRGRLLLIGEVGAGGADDDAQFHLAIGAPIRSHQFDGCAPQSVRGF